MDAAAENTMVVFSAIEELRKDTEEGWKKLAVPLDQVIEANNASNVGLKKRDVQLACQEDIMDGRVCQPGQDRRASCQGDACNPWRSSRVLTSVFQIDNQEVELTILQAQVESNE